jgi:Protein of unknown function (DUF2934)
MENTKALMQVVDNPGIDQIAVRTRSTPQDTGDPSVSIASAAHQPAESRMNRIARRAHEIYEARGGEHGKALEDWLQAERDIDSELEAQPGIDR